ncbi:MAG: radical SAM protein [Archaeoglobaceae archaeon]|nr:radical SAM protein [Archaeoglobaceae archaeon]
MFLSIKKPLLISVSLNNLCGLNCIFCKKDLFAREMDDRVFKKFLEYIIKERNLVCIFSGGEPFLDPRLERILNICKNIEIPTSVDTNCNWERIPNTVSKCSQIRVKILSLEGEKHDMLVGKRGHYEKVIKFINWLNQNFSGSKVLLYPVLSQNLNEIEQIVDFSIKIGFYCNLLFYPRDFCTNTMKKEEFFSLITKLEELIEIYPKKIFLDFPIAGLKKESLINICPAMVIGAHIDVDGFLKPCKFSSSIIGNIKELSIQELWNRKRELVASLNSFCSKCNFYFNCGGGCLANKTKRGVDYYCPKNEGDDQS